eukprot:657400-Amphidinium_carterae.1
MLGPLHDATVTKRDLEEFGAKLSGVFAQTLSDVVVPKFEALDSRISELERKYSELSCAGSASRGTTGAPAPSTPPPPGPKPSFSTPSRGSPSKPNATSPHLQRGTPRHNATSARAMSQPHSSSRARHADDADSHYASGNLPKNFDPADVLVVGWPEPQTIEEFRNLVARVLPVPVDYEVRTPRLFSHTVVI